MSREMFDGFGEEISEGNVLLINGPLVAHAFYGDFAVTRLHEDENEYGETILFTGERVAAQFVAMRHARDATMPDFSGMTFMGVGLKERPRSLRMQVSFADFYEGDPLAAKCLDLLMEDAVSDEEYAAECARAAKEKREMHARISARYPVAKVWR